MFVICACRYKCILFACVCGLCMACAVVCVCIVYEKFLHAYMWCLRVVLACVVFSCINVCGACMCDVWGGVSVCTCGWYLRVWVLSRVLCTNEK